MEKGWVAMAETITSRSVLIVSLVKTNQLLTKKKNPKIINQLSEKIVGTPAIGSNTYTTYSR
jgi:hypothetical protein